MHGPAGAVASPVDSPQPATGAPHESAPSALPAAVSSDSLKWLVCGALLILSGLLYGRMVWDDHQFVQYDDHLYVYLNDQVKEGLSLGGIVWAFSPKAIVAANWHPLTVISHMTDCQFFGTEARWHHLVSLLWHSVDTVLLFLVLSRMTRALGASALVAALFCWHPLHVESVAWASERKDVLSAFFWIAGMWAYVRYVERPGAWRYALVGLCLLLGLLSKPMVVTLPCVFLLLDFWPLGRIQLEGFASRRFWHRAGQLVWEKLPLFAIVAVLAAVTFWAQRQTRAVASLEDLPLLVRVVNVLMSYNAYIAKTVWPATLAIPYGIDARPMTLFQAFLGGIGLILVTVIVFLLRRRCPYWLVGWLWYVGTMVPVIGLVQVGSQSMADRYSYLPLIGIFLGIAFSLRDLVLYRPRLRIPVAAAATAWLIVLAALTYRQVGYWKNTITLFGHTIESVKHSYSGYAGRATGWMLMENYDKAMDDLIMALKISPTNGIARCNRGLLLRKQGQYERAIRDFEVAATDGDYEPSRMYTEMGKSYFELGQPEKALEAYHKAVEAKPDDIDALAGLAVLEMKQGLMDAAIPRFKEVLARKPHLSLHAVMLSRIYSMHPDPKYRNGKEALRWAQMACDRTQRRNALALDTLAAAYAELGDFDKARQNALEAKRRAVFDKEIDFAREIDAHYEAYLVDRPFREDPRDYNLDRS
jgi:tetratricopeptide (TPR) repeat protein